MKLNSLMLLLDSLFSLTVTVAKNIAKYFKVKISLFYKSTEIKTSCALANQQNNTSKTKIQHLNLFLSGTLCIFSTLAEEKLLLNIFKHKKISFRVADKMPSI